MKIKLLLEATDLLNIDNLYKAFERGQISGLSYKKMFEDYKAKHFLKGKKEEQVKKEFEIVMKGFFAALISKVKNVNRENLRQPILTLILKKLKNNFSNISLENFSFDPYLTYFLNKDKQEAKTTHKQLFDDFVNSELNKTKDQKFEQEVNKIFAGKSQVKDIDKEVEVIYPEDKDGWKVLSPKTFAASSKLACMNNRKSRWCTAANEFMFKRYIEGDNKLFIIKNEKKDLMFQMDWGTNNRYGNFMDENDTKVSVAKFLSNDLPDDLLKSIKNKRDESLFDKLKKIKDVGKEIKKEKLEIKEKLKKDVREIKNWKIETFKTAENLKEEYPIFFKKGLIIRKEIFNKEDVAYAKGSTKIASLMSNPNIQPLTNLKKKFNVEEIKKEIYVFSSGETKYLYLEGINSSYLGGKGGGKRILTTFSLYYLNNDKLEHIEIDDLNKIPESIRKIVRRKGIVQKHDFYKKVKEEIIKQNSHYNKETIWELDSFAIRKINNFSQFGFGFHSVEKLEDVISKEKRNSFYKLFKFPMYEFKTYYEPIFKNANSEYLVYDYPSFKKITDEKIIKIIDSNFTMNSFKTKIFIDVLKEKFSDLYYKIKKLYSDLAKKDLNYRKKYKQIFEITTKGK